MKVQARYGYVAGLVSMMAPFFAYASIVTCGEGTVPCTMSDFFTTSHVALYIIVGLVILSSIGTLLGVVVTSGWLKGDSPQAMIAVRNQFFRTVFFGALLAGSVAIFIAILKTLGTQSQFYEIFNRLNLLPSLVDHAYAQSSGLPQPIKIGNPYDYALLLFSMFFRWFVFPAIFSLWIYSGFLLVFAQGEPAGIAKAKKYLWYSLFATVILFLAQGFLLALRSVLG